MRLSPILPCTEKHLPGILAIWNEAILNTTVVYDFQPRTLAQAKQWFEQKRSGKYPVVVLETDEGELAGFATYGPFRPFPAYKYTVEHSIYVEKSLRGKGVGKILMYALINAAQKHDCHVMVGVIDSANTKSIRFHRELGFVPCGTIKQVAYKFDRWLDVDFYQLTFRTPETPKDG